MLQFNAEQLGSAILNLQYDGFCGVVYVEPLSNIKNLQRPRVLSFLNGELTYAGLHLPEPHQLSQQLGQHFKLQIMDAASQLASKKVENQASIRQYLELYIQLELFSWKDVETFICKQIVLTIEEIFPYRGTIKLNPSLVVDLAYGQDGHGFTWQQIESAIAQRQQVWTSLSPEIASINAVPHRIQAAQQTINDAWVQQHIHQWIDGQRTLGDIAHAIDRDPLELAHSYMHYIKMGWLTFQPRQENTTTVVRSTPATIQKPFSEDRLNQESPTILSVDDSAVVQTMIKRAIGNCYNLLLASNAMDALNLLNNEKIDLLLLDVTMPDIDGLELCRTIRKINKFRELPVIMLTAKDGMFNKIKGQMAGSTHYLTKPINQLKLMEVLDKYVPSQAII